MKKLLLLATIFFAFNSFAEEMNSDSTTTDLTTDSTTKAEAKLRDPAEFQKVIDEYKAYVATVPVDIREEIISYRKSIAKLNKQKVLLYKKLSQSSQDYLKKEKAFKERLPMNKKKLISTDILKTEDSKPSSK